jgi:hypothetical protein
MRAARDRIIAQPIPARTVPPGLDGRRTCLPPKPDRASFEAKPPAGLPLIRPLMLINPQAVLIAIEQSGRLGALNSRVCRPLDKPLIPKRDSEDQRTFDDVADDVREPIGDTELGTIY